jgi:hypothetical protein
MRSMPDTANVASLNGFWTRRIWRQALRDSQPLHDYEMRQRRQGEWTSDAAPGHLHDMTCAHIHDLPAALCWAASQLNLLSVAGL